MHYFTWFNDSSRWVQLSLPFCKWVNRSFPKISIKSCPCVRPNSKITSFFRLFLISLLWTRCILFFFFHIISFVLHICFCCCCNHYFLTPQLNHEFLMELEFVENSRVQPMLPCINQWFPEGHGMHPVQNKFSL